MFALALLTPSSADRYTPRLLFIEIVLALLSMLGRVTALLSSATKLLSKILDQSICQYVSRSGVWWRLCGE